MKTHHCLGAVLFALAGVLPGFTDHKKPDVPAGSDGFVPMFNGKDLAGWVNVNCAPSTFFVKDGEIVTTGKPTGYLRTTRQYENFIAEFDWMHIPPKPGEVGNSGFFVWADPIPAIGTGYTRGIEVQVLVNLTYKNKKGEITATSQGDLFSIWGATCVPDRPHPDGWARCLPAENHCKGENEWNHYRVEANDGVLKLAVNGHFVSGLTKCSPRKGYLALESEGSECHFRNLRIKELPSTNPKPNEIADEDKGFRNLYTGLDLSGWKADDAAKKHWQPRDWTLHTGGGAALATEKAFGDAEFIVDFKFPAKKNGGPASQCEFIVREGLAPTYKLAASSDGKFTLAGPGRETTVTGLKPNGQWNRLHATIRGDQLSVICNGAVRAMQETNLANPPATGALTLHPSGEMDFANLFVRQLDK
jgi:hypothetical protein